MGAFKGWADGELDNQPDGSVSFTEAQSFVAHKLPQLGYNTQPTVFSHDELKEFSVFSSEKLEKSPSDQLWEEVSISIRMRSFSDQAELIRAKASSVWNDVLFDTITYKNNVMQKHLTVHRNMKFKKSHFEVWISYFFDVIDANFSGEKSIVMKNRASSIATVMQLKMNIYK